MNPEARASPILSGLPRTTDPDDMRALAQANPGLGTRLSLDHVASERAAMDDETFKRELGIWAKIGRIAIRKRPGLRAWITILWRVSGGVRC